MPLLQPTMLSSTLVSKLISFLSFLSLKATSTCSLKILFFTCLVSSVAVASESDVDHVKYHSSDVIEVKHLIQNSSFTCFTKVEVVNLEPSDYEMGPSYTKEYSLVGKDKKKEKLRVMNKQSLFNKNFKVASKMWKCVKLRLNPGVQVWPVWMQGWGFGFQGGRTGFFRLFVVVTISIYDLKIFVTIWIPTISQATRCSFSGKLASDPDSTVYISGCAGEESMDISLMSKKVDATSFFLLLVLPVLILDLVLILIMHHAIASPFFS